MRSHLALELIATIWLAVAAFAMMENMRRLVLAALVIGAVYMTRALYTWAMSDINKVGRRTDAKNLKNTKLGVYASGTRMRHFESGQPDDRRTKRSGCGTAGG